AYIKPSIRDSLGDFGSSLSLNGNTMVVGAPGHTHGTGSAFVFVRSPNSWRQEALLKASKPAAPDSFGKSVAVCGNTIVVGAPQESSKDSGINGNGGGNSAMHAGAAYVFIRSGIIWRQQAYLKAS